MALRFYTDTHIAKQIAIQLRQKDIDVVRCEEVGLAEALAGGAIALDEIKNSVIVID